MVGGIRGSEYGLRLSCSRAKVALCHDAWIFMNKDRRARVDRRLRDVGPPGGCFERRRRAERRLGYAEDTALSDEEFASYFGSVARDSSQSSQFDEASEVLARARDRY